MLRINPEFHLPVPVDDQVITTPSHLQPGPGVLGQLLAVKYSLCQFQDHRYSP